MADGKPGGQGIYLNLNKGIKYSGDWKNGRRHGIGYMKFENQEVYHEEWHKDTAIE